MYTLPIKHRVLVQVSYTGTSGAPASKGDKPDQPEQPTIIRWTSSGKSVVIKTDPADNTKCYVTGQTLGRAQVTATNDVDPGAPIRYLVTVFDVEVIESVSGEIKPIGDPQPV